MRFGKSIVRLTRYQTGTAARGGPPRARLTLEALEDRLVPSAATLAESSSQAAALVPQVAPDTFPGESGQLDGRNVSADVERDASRVVTALNLHFSGDLVRNPPTSEVDAALTLPPQAAGSPFTHLQIGFEPNGHPPPGVYTFPHFDFHFYTIPQSERLAIAGAPTTADPGPDYRPAGFAPPAATVPEMGGHSYDKTGPEFNGGTFSKTFMYGFFNQQIAFLEAAMTPTYMNSVAGMANPQVEFDIAQPHLYTLPGTPTLFPTRYRLTYDPGSDMFTMSVRGLVTVPAWKNVEIAQPFAGNNDKGDGLGDYVRDLYRTLLGRLASDGEIATWVGMLNAGVSEAEVVQGIYASPEHRLHQAQHFYEHLLGRPATAEEAQIWATALQNGASERDVASAFLLSPEFQAGKDNEAFVRSLYQVLMGREADQEGLNAWLILLGSGGTRADVASGFLRSEELGWTSINAYYGAYLGRQADTDGFNAWLAAFQDGSTTDASMARAFLASNEFLTKDRSPV